MALISKMNHVFQCIPEFFVFLFSAGKRLHAISMSAILAAKKAGTAGVEAVDML